MASHFECIGLYADSEEGFGDLLVRLAEKSTVVSSGPNGRMLRWLDESGASLFLHLDNEDSIDCVTPSYDGNSYVQARVGSFLEQDECRQCNPAIVEILDEAAEMVYPMALQLEDVESARRRFKTEGRIQLRVAGFAEQFEAWSTEGEFFESQADARIRYAVQSFVPVGQFGTPTTPHATMTGIVVNSQVRQNWETRRNFWLGRVNTLGAQYEIVATPQQIPPQLQPGWVVRCTCWMVGDMLPEQAVRTPRRSLLHQN